MNPLYLKMDFVIFFSFISFLSRVQKSFRQLFHLSLSIINSLTSEFRFYIFNDGMGYIIYHTDVLIELSYWFETLIYKISSQNDEKSLYAL